MEKFSGLAAIRSIDYTILICEDLIVMQRFYADIMGFEVRNAVAGKWAELQVGSSLLALRLRSRPYDGPRPAADTASVQLAFRVPPAAVSQAATQLAELGIELLEPMVDLESFGHRALFFADPESNVIEIYAEI